MPPKTRQADAQTPATKKPQVRRVPKPGQQKHPLQRLPSPSPGLSSILHFIGVSSFGASYKYLVDYPSLINDSYGWHFQYLTIIGLTLSTMTFVCGSFADMTSSTTLFRLKNILSTCSAPLEVLISVLYWSIRSIDKHLVQPPWAELGLWADIGFHLVPSALLAIDFLLFSPPWSFSFLKALSLSSCIAVPYLAWVEQCYRHNGFYPYPLFDQVSTPIRLGLFVMSAVLMAGSTMALQWLYQRVNGTKARR